MEMIFLCVMACLIGAVLGALIPRVSIAFWAGVWISAILFNEPTSPTSENLVLAQLFYLIGWFLSFIGVGSGGSMFEIVDSISSGSDSCSGDGD